MSAIHSMTAALADCRDQRIANPCRPTVLPTHRVLAHDCAVVMHRGRLALARMPLPVKPTDVTHALPIGELVFER